MYEVKTVKGLDYKYLVNPETQEVWRVDSLGNKKICRHYLQKSGYKTIALSVNGRRKLFYLHRVIWESVNGSIPKGYQINHKDYNRSNDNINNLEVLTVQDNLRYSNKNREMNRAKEVGIYKDNILVKEFASNKECSEYLGVPAWMVSDHIRGVSRKEGIKGYTIRYRGEE